MRSLAWVWVSVFHRSVADTSAQYVPTTLVTACSESEMRMGKECSIPEGVRLAIALSGEVR